MGAFLGLVLGLGLLLIWRSGPRSPRRGRRSIRDTRSELLQQAGIEGVRTAHLAGAQAVCAVGAAGAVLVITSTVSLAICFGAFGFVAPVVVLRRMRRRRQAARREVWPEAIDNLASAVRAGMSLPEGLSALGDRGPAELAPAFRRFGASYRVSGRFDACLDALKEELADPVGDRVCETVRVARDVGGNDLGATLI